MKANSRCGHGVVLGNGYKPEFTYGTNRLMRMEPLQLRPGQTNKQMEVPPSHLADSNIRQDCLRLLESLFWTIRSPA